MAETTREIIRSGYSDEAYIHIKHKSGLDIYVWKMDGFKTTHAVFGTKYGSINNSFICDGDEKKTDVPEGIAHFLEHKLFENEDTDVFDLYAKTGADANAFTSFDRTCYYFTCTSNWRDSLEILLNFVQEPYFTKESVEKEQGIIGQEIKMCNDDPYWIVLFNLIKAAYHKHPVTIDIAGTVESIAQITPELLYKCYGTYYNLNNMVLTIAGDCDEESVLEICDRLLKPSTPQKLTSLFPDEPSGIVTKEKTAVLPVGIPIFQFGIKSRPEVGNALNRAEAEANIVLDLLADSGSELTNRLLSSGLISSPLSYEVFCGEGFFMVMLGGEAAEPHKVAQEIREEIERFKINGFDNEHFDRIKKSILGSKVRERDLADDLAFSLANCHFTGAKFFDTLPLISKITADDIMRCINERFDLDNACLSIVRGDDEQTV